MRLFYSIQLLYNTNSEDDAKLQTAKLLWQSHLKEYINKGYSEEPVRLYEIRISANEKVFKPTKKYARIVNRYEEQN